jgi:hypothetical protein
MISELITDSEVFSYIHSEVHAGGTEDAESPEQRDNLCLCLHEAMSGMYKDFKN